MKLSNQLAASGVLGRGETRHCSDWEIRSAPVCRFGNGLSDQRLIHGRRLGKRPMGRWGRVVRLFRRSVQP